MSAHSTAALRDEKGGGGAVISWFSPTRKGLFNILTFLYQRR